MTQIDNINPIPLYLQIKFEKSIRVQKLYNACEIFKINSHLMFDVSSD